jgi:hypothetical protein
MRYVVAVVLLVAACDLRPAPKDATPPRDAGVVRDVGGDAPVAGSDAASMPVAIDAMVVPPDAAVDAAPDAAAIDADTEAEPSADCVITAQQIANVVIDGVDPGVRGHYEQGRANIVRLTAAACTTQGWNADKQECFRVAKLEADIRACEAKYPKPQ